LPLHLAVELEEKIVTNDFAAGM